MFEEYIKFLLHLKSHTFKALAPWEVKIIMQKVPGNEVWSPKKNIELKCKNLIMLTYGLSKLTGNSNTETINHKFQQTWLCARVKSPSLTTQYLRCHCLRTLV